MTTKKTIIIAAGIIIVAVAAWLVFKGKSNAPVVSYETAKVEKATIGNSVTATGTIEPVTEVEVGTQVSGIISKIYVDYNSVVRKGQVIAELDKTNLLSDLSKAKDNMSGAKSALDKARMDYKSYKALYDKGLVSSDEYQTKLLALRQAESTYAVQKESVAQAQTNLGYAIITSPIDGVVISKAVEEGQTVAASYSTPTLFTIAQDLTDMRVIADVDEADIGEVAVGQSVIFTVDAYPNDTFEGKVTQVRQEATTESNVVTYEVVISAANEDLKLKPGLTANVTISTLQRNNILSVPTKALRFTPTTDIINPGDKIVDCSGTHKVWVREGNTIKAYSVKTGITNGTRTQIISGIKEGAQVITGVTDAVTTGETAESDESSERSPFAPGPRNNNKKK